MKTKKTKRLTCGFSAGINVDDFISFSAYYKNPFVINRDYLVFYSDLKKFL